MRLTALRGTGLTLLELLAALFIQPADESHWQWPYLKKAVSEQFLGRFNQRAKHGFSARLPSHRPFFSCADGVLPEFGYMAEKVKRRK